MDLKELDNKLICVFIPALNEEKTISNVIGDIKKLLGRNIKIIVVDDGSTDETSLIAKREGAVVVRHSVNKGLAEAYRTGMKEILKLKPDLIIQTDADGQYLASEMPKLLEPLIKDEADLVLGSRFKGKIEKMPLIKRLGNKAFSRLISNITGLKISDGQTGFRAFLPCIAEKIKVMSDYTYTQEVILRASMQKFRIVEVPVTFLKRKDGKSRLMNNSFHYAQNAMINILRVYRDFKPLKFFGFFGLSSMFIGLIIGLYLIYQWFTIGYVGSTAKPILSVLFLTTGLQLILFGFLADMKKGD